MTSQIDFYASFAKLTGQKITGNDAPDSYNALDVLLGKSKANRTYLVEHALNGTLSLIKGDWKYIEPGKGAKISKETNIETGYDAQPQLYNIKTDISERKNLASENEKQVKKMEKLLKLIRDNGE